MSLKLAERFDPRQPRDGHGKFARSGSGDRQRGQATRREPARKAPASGVGLSRDPSRVTPRRAGLPENIGRSIFRRAGAAAGRRETQRILRRIGMRELRKITRGGWDRA